jgi:hypothetical protein
MQPLWQLQWRRPLNEGITGWVKQGKASIDGHLSAYGQKYFAQTLYKELMKSFEIYQLSHKNSH